MKRALCALASCLVLPSAVLANSTKSFVIDTSDAFEKGKLEGVASYSTGVLKGAFSTERTAVEGAPIATSSVLGSDDTIYIGTGNEGAVYKVNGTNSKLFAKTDAAAITSLALQGNTLFLGSIPQARVFSLDVQASDAKPKELSKLEGAEHVWGLAYDAKAGVLYAATGPEGKLFSIDSAGRARVLYDDPAEHLLCVALDQDGSVLVGTSQGARLLRIKGTSASVLHDFPGQELGALSTRGGLIAAGVNEFSEPGPLPADPTRDPTVRLKRPKPGKGKLYALSEGGRVDELYASDNAHITAVEIEAGAEVTVLAGLSQDGRIVRATLNGERALWADVDERQVVSLGLSSRTPYFVTSDGVAVYRKKPSTDGGQWTSAALDAKFPARWGTLNLRARGKLSWQTRSGNTETPDATWSEWSQEADGSGVVRSVKGRFLQARVKLAKDAELYGLTAYYLADNQPARVKNIRVKPSKKDVKNDGAAPKAADGSATHTLNLTWEFDNPDEDRLRYRLYYRRDEQESWLAMLREHEVLDQNDYGWDTRAVPDGRYRVRVVASDELVNPKPYVRSMETISSPLLVDNHAPDISQLNVKGGLLTGRVVDGVGPVSSIEVSIDGEPYAPVFPSDDLLDTEDERFSVQLGALTPGTHIASVRAMDAAQNIGSKAIEFAIQR